MFIISNFLKLIINSVLRDPFRKVLKYLTQKTLQKHQPVIIAITGDGQTSIAREMVYEVIHQRYPCRRNLESPELEFSVPLAVFGYQGYPKSILQWAKIVVKTYLQLRSIQPFQHYLVLELSAVNKDILKFWLEITKPEVLMIVGKSILDYSEYSFKKVVKVSNTDVDDILGPYKIAVRQIARYFRIEDKVIDNSFQAFSLPSSKIRFLPGKNKSLVIDASYYYHPTKIQSVIELVENGEGKKVIFSHDGDDLNFIKPLPNNSEWTLNPDDFQLQKDDTIIIRGDKTKVFDSFNYLLDEKVHIF